MPADAMESHTPIELDCLMEPRVTTNISTRVAGVVDQFFVDRGDYVERDQVLVTLDSAIEEASVALAKSRAELVADIEASRTSLAHGRRKATRFDGLYQQKAVAAHTLDEAQTEALLAAANLKKAKEDRRVAELQLQQANETLELRTIRSPFSGVIVDRLLAVGESVEDKPIIQVAQIDPLYVEAIAPVQYFFMVKPGMQGVVRPEEPIGGEYTATVKVVDQVIDAASGTFRIRLELPNRDRSLPAGLKCRVALQSDIVNIQHKTANNPKSIAIDTAATVAATETPVVHSAKTDDLDTAVTQPTNAEDLDTSVTQPSKTEDLDTVAALDRCFTVGPISNHARAQSFVSTIDQELVDHEIRETTKVSTTGYVLHSAPQRSLKAARQLERKLRNKGVDDIATIRRGSLANHVSFGVYNHRGLAKKRCREISRLNVACKITPRRRKDEVKWVDLAFKTPPSDLNQLQGWLKPNKLLKLLSPRICNPSLHAEAP